MKRRTIITSVLVIVLCLGLISGSTFALFTSTSSVNIAVTSGKVNIDAKLGSLKLYSADATLGQGTLVDKVNPLDEHPGEILPTDPQGAFAGTYYYRDQTSVGKFLNGGTAAIENGELKITKITPGDKVTTNITITNESNVDIQYRVKVNVLSGLKLYEGLVVKVDGLSLKGVQKVSNWTYKAIPVNETEKTIATIPVEVYLPLDAGNEYQDLSTSMQITVEAVQGNAKTTNDTLNTSVNVEEPVANTASLQGQVITDNNQLVEVSVPAEAFGDEIPVTTTSLSVKIEPQDTTYNLVLTSTQASQSYDLEVLVKTQVGTENPTTAKYNANNDESATALKIKMFVGTDLTGVKLYHKTTPLTAVATLSAVDELNEYYYDSTEGYITLMTNSFSEYTVVYNKDIAVETVDEQTQKSTITVYTPTEDANVYTDPEGKVVQIKADEEDGYKVDTLFEGGKGTSTDPYLISTFNALLNVDAVSTGSGTLYYRVTKDLVAVDSESWANGSLYSDPVNYVIDLYEHTLTVKDKPIFGYATNLELYNGTINFVGNGSVVDYACYQEIDSYNMYFHDLVLTGGVNTSATHYGPLVQYAFGLNSGKSSFNASNIVNNMTINNNNSAGYTGGLFGYVQGSAVSSIVTNCTFNGTIVSAYAGGFLNPCSYPNAGMTSTGNTFNGQLLASITAIPFGCNGNLTGGKAALDALQETVTLGTNAQFTVVAPSTTLITAANNNDEVVLNKVEGASTYRVAVLFMVNNVDNGTGGYPRYITVDVDKEQFVAESVNTGIYRYAIHQATGDESAGKTVVTNQSGTLIWIEADGYHVYQPSYVLSNSKATIYAYAYDANGNIITYQTIPYSYEQ